MGLWSLLQEEKTSTKLHVSGNIDIKNDVVVSIEKGMHFLIWCNTSTYRLTHDFEMEPHYFIIFS